MDFYEDFSCFQPICFAPGAFAGQPEKIFFLLAVADLLVRNFYNRYVDSNGFPAFELDSGNIYRSGNHAFDAAQSGLVEGCIGQLALGDGVCFVQLFLAAGNSRYHPMAADDSAGGLLHSGGVDRRNSQ